MATAGAPDIHRPLRLGELLAATVRIFGDRAWPLLALGGVEALVLIGANALPLLPGLGVLAISFAIAFAVAARLVAGDGIRAAWLAAGRALPVLLPLGFVVAVPFYLGFVAGLLMLVLSAGWLGLTAFSVPAAMVETPADPSWLGRARHALARTIALARTNFVHAAGVSAALLVVYILFSVLLAGALRGYADNTRLVAQALAQVPLAPFFFVGLSVLYFEQVARDRER
ncbi:MAG: hypothetical protein IT201_13245 [Thermoleophilia bacterium]|nr:hypothetical protein [Thermoleophilia bacterium]